MVQSGDHIAGYRIVGRLGAGGMGEVFLGRHHVLERLVAIKVLRAQDDAKQVARFMDEARAAAAIDHPSIVHIVDCDYLSDGRAYIVMEHLAGLSLREASSLQPPLRADINFIAALLGEAALALGAAHERGIIHRDVKPENLFLQHDSRYPGRLRLKVLDFGIAKLVHLDRIGSLTKSGALLGTPQYMSPEQCRGEREVDGRADVYALGCVAFELLSGALVFRATSIGAMLIMQVTEEAPPLRELAPETPEQLAALVNRMLVKAPEGRPQSMHEVAHELVAFLGCAPDQLGQWLVAPTHFPGRPPGVVPAALPPSATGLVLAGDTALLQGSLIGDANDARPALIALPPVGEPIDAAGGDAVSPAAAPPETSPSHPGAGAEKRGVVVARASAETPFAGTGGGAVRAKPVASRSAARAVAIGAASGLGGLLLFSTLSSTHEPPSDMGEVAKPSMRPERSVQETEPIRREPTRPFEEQVTPARQVGLVTPQPARQEVPKAPEEAPSVSAQPGRASSPAMANPGTSPSQQERAPMEGTSVNAARTNAKAARPLPAVDGSSSTDHLPATSTVSNVTRQGSPAPPAGADASRRATAPAADSPASASTLIRYRKVSARPDSSREEDAPQSVNAADHYRKVKVEP